MEETREAKKQRWHRCLKKIAGHHRLHLLWTPFGEEFIEKTPWWRRNKAVGIVDWRWADGQGAYVSYIRVWGEDEQARLTKVAQDLMSAGYPISIKLDSLTPLAPYAGE